MAFDPALNLCWSFAILLKDGCLNNTIDGWEISQTRNVHMYTHALSVQKGQYQFRIDCEDLPTPVKTIGVWLGSLEAPDELKKELQAVLLKWDNLLDVKCEIHVGEGDVTTREQNTQW